jgi:hypothetical protein
VRRFLLIMIVAIVLIGAAGAAIGLRTGSGETSPDVSLTVTRDFGVELVGEQKGLRAGADDTVMRLLQRHFDVKTRYGGGFVQSIEGISGGREESRQVDWFYYVNGLEAGTGSADRRVSPGDRIWWDRHVWASGGAMRIPAVVGSFPEPFGAGTEGKRIPVKLVCAGAVERECEEVERRLGDAGATGLTRSTIHQGAGPGVLRVIVGRWADVRADPVARTLERGPAASGVFVRPDPLGKRLVLLDELGRPARTLDASAGLVAATLSEGQQATWIVTGTDEVGVAAAAAALQEDRLAQHFAVAIEGGHGIPLPVSGPGAGP